MKTFGLLCLLSLGPFLGMAQRRPAKIYLYYEQVGYNRQYEEKEFRVNAPDKYEHRKEQHFIVFCKDRGYDFVTRDQRKVEMAPLHFLKKVKRCEELSTWEMERLNFFYRDKTDLPQLFIVLKEANYLKIYEIDPSIQNNYEIMNTVKVLDERNRQKND